MSEHVLIIGNAPDPEPPQETEYPPIKFHRKTRRNNSRSFLKAYRTLRRFDARRAFLSRLQGEG